MSTELLARFLIIYIVGVITAITICLISLVHELKGEKGKVTVGDVISVLSASVLSWALIYAYILVWISERPELAKIGGAELWVSSEVRRHRYNLKKQQERDRIAHEKELAKRMKKKAREIRSKKKMRGNL
jgi:hypothetical protein